MDALASQPVERRSAPRDSPGVLLVDHETALRSVLARQLQARGYRVISAASGGEALTLHEGLGALAAERGHAVAFVAAVPPQSHPLINHQRV